MLNSLYSAFNGANSYYNQAVTGAANLLGYSVTTEPLSEESLSEEFFTLMEYPKPIVVQIMVPQDLLDQRHTAQSAPVEASDNNQNQPEGYFDFYLANPKHPNLTSLDDQGKAPIHYAAIHNRLDIIDLYVNNGLDLSLKDSNQQTALHYAAYDGHLEFVQRLVRQGISISDTDCHGNSALVHLIQRFDNIDKDTHSALFPNLEYLLKLHQDGNLAVSNLKITTINPIIHANPSLEVYRSFLTPQLAILKA